MIILASLSPRRKEILSKAIKDFKIIDPNIEEVIKKDASDYEKIMQIALDKATAVFQSNPNDIIIAADTVVILNKEILGKPKDKEDAFLTLKKLNNNTHSVVTAVAILSKDKKKVFYDESFVTFKNNTDSELKDYVDTKEPLDKAGSYAIQGIGNKLVSKYEGDLDNIIGLPLIKVLENLKLMGI